MEYKLQSSPFENYGDWRERERERDCAQLQKEVRIQDAELSTKTTQIAGNERDRGERNHILSKERGRQLWVVTAPFLFSNLQHFILCKTEQEKANGICYLAMSMDMLFGTS